MEAQRQRSARASDRSRTMTEVLSSPLAGGDAGVVLVTDSLSDGTSTAGKGSVMMRCGAMGRSLGMRKQMEGDNR